MLKKIFISFLTLVLIVSLASFIFIYLNNQPVSQEETVKLFTIKSGESVNTIAQNLQENNLIKNKYVFLYYSYKLSLNQKIQAGDFKVSPNLSTKEIVVKLSKGGVADYWLKIIDGSRNEELSKSFPDNLTFTGNDFVAQTPDLQGYLYPDSYLIPQHFTIDQILETIQTNFNKKFAQAQEGGNSDLSVKDIIIFASLLEREGRSLESKQMIAGILFNRLSLNMPLQIDATVQYARDSQNQNITNYWQPATKSDLQTNSPFNTYQNQGLPPKPICNPGYNSLYATFHPTESDYLYYITGNDNKMHYAITLDEHNSNIAKYLK